MNMHAPARARALRAATIVAGAAALVAAALQAPLEATATLSLLFAGVVLAELLEITGQADADVEQPKFSFSSAVHLAAVLLLGVWAAVLVAVVGVLVVDRLRKAPWGKVAFNAGVFALAALAGGAAFVAAGGSPGTLDLPGDFAAIAAAAVAYGTVNAVLVTLMIVFWSGAPVRGALPRSLASTTGSSTAEAALGVLLALCALEEPWAVAAVVPLVVAAYQAHARHVQLRHETAQALATFANVIDERDSGTYRHSARVAALVGDLARGLRLPAPEVARLESAGRLHDLGKIAVDAAVLRKPGKLSGEEWAAMRRHPRLSARLLQRFQFAAGEAHAVEHHHERYDGRGYYGVGPDEVPLAAHFLVVADTFDAMCSDRPYRRGLTEAEALNEIERNAGTQFHPAVAKAFVAQRRGEDPVEALTPDEYLGLRQLTVRAPQRRRLPAFRSELLPAPALAVGLTGAGFGHLEVLGGGLALAAAVIASQKLQARRLRRLAARLRGAIGGSPRESFDRLVSALAGETSLGWTGLVAWQERELSGTLVLASGDQAQAPGETGLTSWLIRDSEAGGELLVDGRRVAVPLVREDTTIGYFVFVFNAAPSVRVKGALAVAQTGLSECFAGIVSAGRPERLSAVL
jgi:HD-GYP domain-containing protein (c-di-GMP phosphodiesterase class II)